MRQADSVDEASVAAAEMLDRALNAQQEAAKEFMAGMDSMQGVCLMCGHPSITSSRFCCAEDRDEYDQSVSYLARTGLPPHRPASGVTMESYLDVVRRIRK